MGSTGDVGRSSHTTDALSKIVLGEKKVRKGLCAYIIR